MYFSSSLILSFALGALASPSPVELLRRNAADVNSALKMVKTGLDDLDTSVKAIQGPMDINGLANVAGKSDSLGKTLKTAQTMVDNTGPIGLFDALSVMKSANGLTSSLMSTTMDLVTQKPTFDQAGLTPVVKQMLVMQKAGSGGLAMSIQSKLPALAAPLAGGTMKDIMASLDSAIKAFSENATTAAAPKPNAGGNSTAAGVSAPKPNAAGSNSTTSGASAPKPNASGAAAPKPNASAASAPKPNASAASAPKPNASAAAAPKPNAGSNNGTAAAANAPKPNAGNGSNTASVPKPNAGNSTTGGEEPKAAGTNSASTPKASKKAVVNKHIVESLERWVAPL